MMVFAVAGLAFLALAGIGLAFTSGEGDAAKKRAKAIGAGVSAGKVRGKVHDENSKRRAKTEAMLDNLRKQDKERRKSITPRDVASKISQAGLELPVTAFWIGSFVLGLVCAFVIYLSGADGLVISGISFKSKPVMIAGAFLAGSLGLPRYILGFLTKSRYKKMINQFADALDIIVRGVRSGLPLNECIRIIAKESSEPLRKEFVTLADNLAMGAGLDRSLNSFYKRVPLQEVNFFVIVLMIQAKAGGNLSEALGNLSTVIRARKMMREKVKALSSEAKASAMIIGVLPFAVGLMVFMTTPDYIMQLFITETGHVILAVAATMMGMGVMVMRKMINFDM
ncbi:MAG: type II secretion system F family protein [Alphaproteobacteria bacterium]|nr:type II secretion system F family protein [Alphaproteobacteria bacterium]MBU2085278.1 type II secretion system F family protein [Alphaproteobacteria bacterium]MBU2142373.1 type II secretion system F family protein [Alphaproteobacteria bacterium]MBU2197509.1 type II secretion system F family protein [Alphaproteobacteria bacterium]